MIEVGDTVMWTNTESTYAKWFYSHIGVVESINKGHCRVRWCAPVKYHDRYTASSDFSLDNFTTFRANS